MTITQRPHPAGTAGRLLVAECFGPTLQGEGPSAGSPAAFIRLSRCNLACGWCDEPQTWDTRRFDLRAESAPRSVDEVAAWAVHLGVALVVITGGEPLLQQRGLVALVEGLLTAGRRVEIETNGTRVPLPELLVEGVVFNVSPKLAHAQLPAARRIRPDALAALAASGQAVFKFVAQRPADLEEIAELVGQFGLSPVWVMPEGTTPAQVITRAQGLAEGVIARGWRLSHRLQVLLWPGQRGH